MHRIMPSRTSLWSQGRLEYTRDKSRDLRDSLERILGESLEDVSVRMLKQSERNGAVMVLQWRNVVISERQLCPGVYLINIIVPGMVEIVTDAGHEQD